MVEIELALADLASAEKARDKTQRMLKGDASLKRTVDLLDKVVDTLGEDALPSSASTTTHAAISRSSSSHQQAGHGRAQHW